MARIELATVLNTRIGRYTQNYNTIEAQQLASINGVNCICRNDIKFCNFQIIYATLSKIIVYIVVFYKKGKKVY